MKYFVFVLAMLMAIDCFADDANVIVTKQYVDGGIEHVSDATDKKITDAIKDLVNKSDQILNSVPVGQPTGDVPDGRVAVWVD